MVGSFPLWYWNINVPISSSYIFVIGNFLEGGLEQQFDIDLDSMIFIIFWCICFSAAMSNSRPNRRFRAAKFRFSL